MSPLLADPPRGVVDHPMAADEAVALDGVPIVEINPERTAVSYVLDVKINGAAAEVLDDIWERYRMWWPCT